MKLFWDVRRCLGCQWSVVSWMSVVVMVRILIRSGIVIGVIGFLIEEIVRAIPMIVVLILSEVSVGLIMEE